MYTKNISLILGLAIAAIAFTLTFGMLGYADEFDQATVMTFSGPVRIPGKKVLPGGTYLFKLIDSAANQDFVQIFNAEGTRLYATVLTVPTDRMEPTGKTEVTLAEPGEGRPEALLTWFYPGCLTGHEFVYSRHEGEELARDKRQTLAMNSQTAPGSKAAFGFGPSLLLVLAGL
jgi:hypothetical protein